jgi:hypothetical protein
MSSSGSDSTGSRASIDCTVSFNGVSWGLGATQIWRPEVSLFTLASSIDFFFRIAFLDFAGRQFCVMGYTDSGPINQKGRL